MTKHAIHQAFDVTIGNFMETEMSELIGRAVSGDNLAIERLLVSYGTRLSGHISRKLPSSLAGRESVDDILQQTYVRAIRGIDQLDGRTEEVLWAWLRNIAENQILNRTKAHQRKKRSGGWNRVRQAKNGQASSLANILELLCDDGETPGRAAVRVESVQAVQVAVAALPDDQRRVIQLRFFEGLTMAETAAELNRSPGAVNALQNRAKKRLRDALQRSSL